MVYIYTEQRLFTLDVETINCLEFSRDGLCLASGDSSGSLSLYDRDVSVADSLRTANGIFSIIWNVSDHSQLLFGDDRGLISLLNVEEVSRKLV